MAWYLLAILLMLLALAILCVKFIQDRRYLKRKTAQAMSKHLWDEIQEEREASGKRRERFRAAIEQASGKKGIT